jgi:CheY-like chemotaxis protein
MKLLYVEGNPCLAELFTVRLPRFVEARWQVYHVPDPYEAVDYLSGARHYGNRARFPMPDLVFLRLSPRMGDGLDLLAWLRAEKQFFYLPLVVFSATDTQRAQELVPHACFARTSELWEVVQRLDQMPPLATLPERPEPVPNEQLAA